MEEGFIGLVSVLVGVYDFIFIELTEGVGVVEVLQGSLEVFVILVIDEVVDKGLFEFAGERLVKVGKFCFRSCAVLVICLGKWGFFRILQVIIQFVFLLFVFVCFVEKKVEEIRYS